MLSPLILIGLLIQGASPSTAIGTTARGPAYASDGRLAVSIEGDLWIRGAGASDARWMRVTAGPEWDRDPAWTPDGAAIVFTTDRSGNGDIWRVAVGASGVEGEPQRLTTATEPDGEATVARGGSIVFVRGRGSTARIWVRGADGVERRLTTRDAEERWPAAAPDSDRVAYVHIDDAGRRLRLRGLTGTVDSVIVGERAPEYPSWSPAGDRLLFSSGTPRAGIYVASLDGRYVNLVSARRGESAWSPDGRSIAIAEWVPDESGYNGDPRRLNDRELSERFVADGRLVTIDAPQPPEAGLRDVAVSAPMDRAARNAAAFDRFWSRSDSLYFSGPGASARRSQWRTLRDAYRTRALAAASDADLERVLHAMLRERPTLRDEATGRAGVSSAHPVATAAGLEILSRGGNVVDAAVAVSFALGVVEPDASGIGGYGEMLVHLKGMERPALIEFMSRVPEEATLANAALMQNGRYPSDGPVLAIVPGTVAGMHTAWKRFGSQKVAWADLVAPAIRAAREGFVVSDGLATTLSTEREAFLKYEGSKALFFRDGKPLAAGDTLKNPDLAWTLERIAKDGADGFYKGEVARRLVNDLRGKGNAMRLTDLSRYFAPARDPVVGTYRGHTIYSSAPPVAGGAGLVAELNLLEQVAKPKIYADDAASFHAMVSAWQLQPTSRNRIADPGLWPVTIEPLVNKDTAKLRWRCFDPDRALTPLIFRGDTLACAAVRKTASAGGATASRLLSALAAPDCDHAEHAREASACRANGTTAFAVADADGNMVAVTQTLGTWGGNFYVTPGLGFLYNDKLTSYGTDPGMYGARLPYARHGSTLAPTLVFRGTGAQAQPLLALRGGWKCLDHIRGVPDSRWHRGLRAWSTACTGTSSLSSVGTRFRYAARVCHRRRRRSISRRSRASQNDGIPSQLHLAERRVAHGLRRRSDGGWKDRPGRWRPEAKWGWRSNRTGQQIAESVEPLECCRRRTPSSPVPCSLLLMRAVGEHLEDDSSAGRRRSPAAVLPQRWAKSEPTPSPLCGPKPPPIPPER